MTNRRLGLCGVAGIDSDRISSGGVWLAASVPGKLVLILNPIAYCRHPRKRSGLIGIASVSTPLPAETLHKNGVFGGVLERLYRTASFAE